MPNTNENTNNVETKLTGRQQRMLDAAQANAPTGDSTPDTDLDAQESAPEDAQSAEEIPMTTETTKTATAPEADTAPETEAAADASTIEIPDSIRVTARINTNALGTPQARYNLLVLDEASQKVLMDIQAVDGIKATNDKGEFYLEVTMDARSRNQIRRGALGNPKAVITGILTFGDIVNDKQSGHVTVETAVPMTRSNGSRRVVRTGNAGMEPTSDATPTGGASLRSRR